MKWLVLLRKEVRTLLPWWIAAAATVALVGMVSENRGFYLFRQEEILLAAMVYGMCLLVLGAISLGSELAHGTLATLLVQPMRRSQVLVLKLIPLAIAVASIGLVADWFFADRYFFAATLRTMIWGPVVAAIGLVPILTLLTRRALGGVVFAALIVGATYLAGNMVYQETEATVGTWQVLVARWTLMWNATVGLSAAGLIGLFFVFGRLQVASDGRSGGRSGSAAAADAGAAVASRRRHWISALIGKELRLQQMTLALSGFYVLACIAIAVTRWLQPSYQGPSFYALSGLHACFIAVFAGSLASAEERQLGTLSSQLLQPRSTTAQWAIKSGVTLGLVLALGLGLPVVTVWLTAVPDPLGFHEELVAAVVLLTTAGLYVSSLSRNSLWALMASFPAIALAVVVGGVSLDLLADPARRAWLVYPATGYPTRLMEDLVAAAAIGGLALLTLAFAGRNHRSLDWRPGLVARQVGWITAYATTAAIAFFGIVGLLRSGY